ncbi:MAG: M48 family metallopeptidase, partial [Gammaproteobacteria bacterium]|nr:M48 family metallopeptidase [Gammaproteobacteria bacterium]
MTNQANIYQIRRIAGNASVRWLAIIGFIVYFIIYFFSNTENVPLTGRRQLVDLNLQQETVLGLQSYQQILSQSRVVTRGQEVDVVRVIGQRLVAAARDLDPGYKWEFNVLDDNQANAFALPGGKVAVYTGLFPVAENVDGLAVVMGHELAHALARHGAERIAHQKLLQAGSIAASFALGDMSYESQRLVMGAIGAGAQFGVLMPFSRKHES